MLPNQLAIKHLKKDKVLRPVIRMTTLNQYAKSKSCFNALVKSIVSQQLSVKAAASIYARLKALLKHRITKKSLLATDHELLRSVGLSNSKAQYVKNVALFFNEHKLTDKKLAQLTDEQIIQKLTQIKGVGVWTVQMMMMFHLDRLDVFPIGDLEVRKQMIHLYNVKSEGKVLYTDLEAIADQWRPYRTLACIYLWSHES